MGATSGFPRNSKARR